MTSHMVFGRFYMAFTALAEPYQRADDVGYVVTEFMSFKGRPYYPIGALATARIAPVHLSARDFDEADEDNLDLIFRMREAHGGYFFEIVLRSSHGTRYGGWVWGHDVEVLDEVVDGYHVLSTSNAGKHWRFEFRKEKGRYHSVDRLPVEKSVLDRHLMGPQS